MRETDTECHINSQAERERETERDRERQRQTDRQRHKQTDRQTDSGSLRIAGGIGGERRQSFHTVTIRTPSLRVVVAWVVW